MNQFLDYYHLENYLLTAVGERFRENGSLSAFDFFCIIIWKANRAKSKIAKRLLGKGYPDLDSAVTALGSDIATADSDSDRLRVLIERWGFRLPMASAILTILYPDAFTVYDVRVCNHFGDFHNAQNKTKFADLWARYLEFIEAVRASSSGPLSLRDKDRLLWGQSFASQLNDDIAARFEKPLS